MDGDHSIALRISKIMQAMFSRFRTRLMVIVFGRNLKLRAEIWVCCVGSRLGFVACYWMFIRFLKCGLIGLYS